MWGEMAELSFKHLKPDDFIYVAGRLGSNTKADQNGNSRLYHEVSMFTIFQNVASSIFRNFWFMFHTLNIPLEFFEFLS